MTKDFYAGDDPREMPLYTVGQVSHHLRESNSTVRSWFAGRGYPTAGGEARSEPILRPAQSSPIRLSFHNLIEVHMVRALRSAHGSKMHQVRSAIEYAKSTLEIDRLLLRDDLQAASGDLFLEIGELLNLSRSGQVGMRRVWLRHLTRVEFDEDRLPTRLFPFYPVAIDDESDARTIVIDPRISFGRPVIARGSISTAAVSQRYNAGESIPDLAHDFDVLEREIEDAIAYEEAA